MTFMFRRRLIRSLALTLLTLCVVACVGSYWRRVGVFLHFGDLDNELFIHRGDFVFYQSSPISPLFTRIRHWEVYADDFNFWGYRNMPPTLLGFCAFLSENYNGFYVIVPLWFPTLLSAFLLWLVWRKTKPKTTRNAFPVEAASTNPGAPTP